MKGFTFIEVVIALAILTMLFGLTVPVGWDFYTSTTLSGERETLVSLLTRARTHAFTNRNASPHGLALAAPTFTLFQGTSYASRAAMYDQIFPRTASVIITGPSEIVFTPLSGDTNPSTFTLTLGSKSLNVTANQEGMIEY